MKREVLFALGVCLSIGSGCAAGNDKDPFDNEGGDNAGGMIEAGMGGAGGVALPCIIDCSTIEAPPCSVSVCNEEAKQCEIVAGEEGEPCDDGLFCTVEDLCVEGSCTGSAQNECGLTPAPCTSITCDEGTQTCSSAVLENGTDCTDADPCILGGTCQNGLCLGTPNDCFLAPTPNACYLSVCNPDTGDCEPVPGNAGSSCVDYTDLCSTGNTCDTAGNCGGGGPKDCSHLTVGCNDGQCNPISGACFADPIPDGMPCAAATDDCNQGYCVTGSCLPTTINEGLACDDGLTCTSGTTCATGVCTGGVSTIDIFLAEDFSNPVGWTTDLEWEFGPATMSSGHSTSCGYPDPSSDHTSTVDDNIAGVNIGGNASTSLHDFYWLTSPAVDTSAAPTVFLEFYRHLNSDYTRFMQNRVDVWDGTAWQVVWVTGSSSILDDVWTYQSFDLTAFKNAAMQVRFGFMVGSSGVYTCSSWNVDDVLIATGTCM
jgi:hypothetical protein